MVTPVCTMPETGRIKIITHRIPKRPSLKTFFSTTAAPAILMKNTPNINAVLCSAAPEKEKDGATVRLKGKNSTLK
jgi:hypothetical protein